MNNLHRHQSEKAYKNDG
jgi:hypothetical protein